MRAVIQRVSEAGVSVHNKLIANIKTGLVVFLGIEAEDLQEDIEWLSKKILNLRIFDDDNDLPNISVKDIDGEILLISQFTLHASTKKGNRPSYLKAASADLAKPLYENMIIQLQKKFDKVIATGAFGADMKVSLINNGPITIVIDTKNKE